MDFLPHVLYINLANRVDRKQNIEIATLGAGCFWCVEAIFETLDGVMDVKAG